MIDRQATEERVKNALDMARQFIQMGSHPGIEVSTTAGYSLVPPSNTNAFHSSTESAAVKNVDIERMRTEHVRIVLTAVKRLSKKQRNLINVRWFGDDDLTDIEAYVDLDMTHATYYRLRGKAFYTLAGALNLYEFVESDTDLIRN